ncbi:type II toxin-antitoxin system RelE/ParE family toxin [Corynebacterium coyleae]|uniref:type II toxin-antitoxin system RelE/ParE family toxin n=1 Tax=Corynebacterium coyleae TaxID=53374 RepID=UPI000C76EACF|nr:type II toxin-antitoxin system RelE/ParE family toxin [Corynebacterium coyleae]PLA28172.1 hypothetical protein CYJ45_04275 [Corynebacterium coyleae]
MAAPAFSRAHHQQALHHTKGRNLLANVSDERDLRALKSLRLEQLRGDRVGTSSIRLNRQFRLVIRFETDEDRRIVVVIEMVDYH